MSLPQYAYAGGFSFVQDLFGTTASAETPPGTGNSQTIQLLQANINSNPSGPKGGGDIAIVNGTALLPESGPEGTIADVVDNPPSDQISIYVVRPGDTLAGIAKMFGVSANTIVWANDIGKGGISVGQTLTILPISGVRHVVVKGETLQSIAKKYKGDLKEILKFNDLTENSQLAIGDVVLIPDGEVVPVRQTTPSRTSPLRGAGGPTYAGYYMRPISGGYKSQGLHGYNGVDLAASIGSPVMAAATGEVIISRPSGWNGGYGNYVVISHNNGTQTLYAHLSRDIVEVGQSVVQGQVIGYVGSTGKSTGPHLHFEVRGAYNPFQ